MFVNKWVVGAGILFAAISPLEVVADDASQKALVAVVLNEKSHGDDIVKAINEITDKESLKIVLLNARKWESNVGSDIDAKKFVDLCKKVDDQDFYVELLRGGMPQLSVLSFGEYEKEGKYAVWALVDLLDESHLAVMDKERKARRRAVKGKVINCLGFYPGMPFVDFAVLMKTKFPGHIGKDLKYHGSDDVSAKAEYDYHPVLPMCSWAVENIMFDPKFYFSECGISDGLEGLLGFAEKYVPGGSSGYGEPKIDVDNEGWSVIAPQTDTTIIMNTDSKLRLISGKTDIRLDFSKAVEFMDDPGDDDDSTGGNGGGFMSFIVKLLVLGGIICALCLFKGKIDAFVEKNPKYAKVWRIMCTTGAFAKEKSLKVYDLMKAKIKKS